MTMTRVTCGCLLLASARAAVDRVCPASPASEWSTEHVSEWLSGDSLNLPRYRETFLAQDIDGPTLLQGLSETDLQDILQVTTLGHRRKILRAIAELQACRLLAPHHLEDARQQLVRYVLLPWLRASALWARIQWRFSVRSSLWMRSSWSACSCLTRTPCFQPKKSTYLAC
ncbi:unnamed protein product [Polarella glacialis]|uniref:SAM domain-containing protein n=1 Tax=Polarella glacialis TaxID=89957 RepID=A0A813IZG4_POLGL|nr:unnamed protein product [Polarella glacialis]